MVIRQALRYSLCVVLLPRPSSYEALAKRLEGKFSACAADLMTGFLSRTRLGCTAGRRKFEDARIDLLPTKGQQRDDVCWLARENLRQE